MVELKEKELDVYLHTVHVAYLSDKLATALKLDGQSVKTMAYYYKIGLLHGEATYENTLLAIEDYEFPTIAYDYLKDVIENQNCPTTKEAYVVLIAEMIITSMEYLHKKNPGKEIQYESVIDALFKKKMDGNFPRKCGITFGEAEIVKHILLEEKLYYDFLHR